jgi:diguanylate cyclase
VTYSENTDQAADHANQAIEFMEAHQVAPHPQNFEIWFNYASGNNPDLKTAIDKIIDTGEPFTTERTDELYAQYFSLMAEGLQVTEATAKLGQELQNLVSALGEADSNTRDFGNALAEFTGALQSGNESDLKSALTHVAGATADMRQHTSALEKQLDDSASEVRQLRDNLDVMRHEAFTDALTGIANRKMFDHELNRMAQEVSAEDSDLSLLMLDIDHFKLFNDTYGHQVGDKVLQLLAATVKECVKGRDIPARYGGEEFCVILPDTDITNAMTLAEQIRQAIGSKKVINKKTNEDLGRITVSIGAGQFIKHEPLGELIHRADEALYFAKKAGRDQVASEIDVSQSNLSVAAKTG